MENIQTMRDETNSSYKDTLTIYEELMAGGCTETQAKVQAHQLGALGDNVSKSINGLSKRLDKLDKDMFWMRIIGGAMTFAFVTNYFK